MSVNLPQLRVYPSSRVAQEDEVSGFVPSPFLPARVSGRLVLTAVLMILGLLYCRALTAQVINFPNGFASQPSSIWLENNTIYSGSSIRLAPPGTSHTSTNAWFKTVENEQAFTTTFTFHVDCSSDPSDCGDGFGFMMVCACSSNPVYNPPTDPGFTFSGYSSQNFSWSFCDPTSPTQPNCSPLPNEVLVKFDLYNNQTNSPGGEFTGYYTDGELPQYPNPVYDMSGSGINLQSGDEFSCTLTYDGTNLVEVLTDTVTGAQYQHTYTGVNIPAAIGGNTAFIGFGAGTGAALMTNYIDSWTYTVQTPGQAATPTFSPAGGTYTSSQSVTLASVSSGAVVCYNTTGSPATNGSTGCNTGTVYTGPIAVSSNETIYAVAGGTGYSDSAVANASYVIQATVATPGFSPAGGTYASAQSVAISDATSNATIYYTTNGTTPTTSSTRYTAPVTLSSTTKLEAIAAVAGETNSAVASATYNITSLPATATPTFSPAGGTFSSPQSVTISDATTSAVIYYTADGTSPTTSSTQYAGPITVSSTETLRAMAVAPGDTNSAIASASFVINLSLPSVATPAFSPAAGTFTSAQSVTISDATSGATIYYTTNGTTPTSSSTEYTGPIAVSSTETLQAVGVAAGYANSAVVSGLYVIVPALLPTVSAPAFSPVAGAYTSAQSVTISDATPGATVYYTTNGAVPNVASSVYSGPIAVGATETLQAFAVVPGANNSPVTSAAYTISSTLPSVSTPMFSPAAGTYGSAQSVTIADTTSGAAIYYTIDGTTPTTSSILYSGPVAVQSTETLQAIAVAAGPSAVASAVYTISLQPNFLVAASVPSLTLTPGAQGSVTLTVTPVNGFDAPVILACAGLPAGATCSFDEATVTPANGAVSTQLTIATSTQTSRLLLRTLPFFQLPTLAIAVCLLGRRRRRSFHHWLLIVVACAGLGALSGCGNTNGGGGTTSTTQTATTSMVTINAISGSLQGSTTIALVLK